MPKKSNFKKHVLSFSFLVHKLCAAARLRGCAAVRGHAFMRLVWRRGCLQCIPKCLRKLHLCCVPPFITPLDNSSAAVSTARFFSLINFPPFLPFSRCRNAVEKVPTVALSSPLECEEMKLTRGLFDCEMSCVQVPVVPILCWQLLLEPYLKQQVLREYPGHGCQLLSLPHLLK